MNKFKLELSRPVKKLKFGVIIVDNDPESVKKAEEGEIDRLADHEQEKWIAIKVVKVLPPEDARRRMLMNVDSKGTSLDHAGEDTAAHDAHANAEASEYELEFDVKKTIWNKVMLLDFEENEEQGKIPQLEIPMKNIPVKEADDWWLMFFITIIEYTTLIIVIIFIFKRAPLVWHVIDYLVTFCFMIYLNF